MKKLLLLTAIMLQVLAAEAQQVRETVLLDKGWKFTQGMPPIRLKTLAAAQSILIT
jgi:hypothetical protein